MDLEGLLDQVRDLPHGDYAECGVWQGHSALVIKHHMVPGSHLYLFDSFEGHPEPSGFDHSNHPKGRYADTSLEAVSSRLSGDNVTFKQGFFPARFPEVADRKFRFVNCDCDLYQSTKDVLDFFIPLLVPGGILRMDDYNAGDCPGAVLAAHEVIGLENISFPEPHYRKPL